MSTGLPQAVQKPQSQLGQLPLTTPATSSSGLQSPSFSSSQNPLLSQLHQAGGLGQSIGGSALDARLLVGLGIQKQLGGSLLQQQQQQQQSALLSQSRNQADKLRQGESECIEQPQIFVTMSVHQAPLTAWTPPLLLSVVEGIAWNQENVVFVVKKSSTFSHFLFLWLSAASTADVAQVWPGMDQSFTKEVEDEANSYFQRIYNHPPNPTISIDEVLEMLKKFKDSPVKKERVSTVIPGTIWVTVKFLYI